MARIRTIKPEFFSHETLASKSAHARLLAIGLLTLADCEGRIRWVPMQVHAQVFPWEASVNIEVLLGELLDTSYVVHYEVDGKRYVEICNFRKHQRLSGKELGYESRIPPKPEKPNDLQDETGEATGNHPGASLGSSGNPLGTGEHRNIGTEIEVSKDTSCSERSSKPNNDSGFVFALQEGTWHLPEKKLAEYVSVYKFDVRRELLKASQWLRDNKNRRPRSSTGLLKFLTRWMNRADNRIPDEKASARPVDENLKAELARSKRIMEARRSGQVPNVP